MNSVLNIKGLQRLAYSELLELFESFDASDTDGPILH